MKKLLAVYIALTSALSMRSQALDCVNMCVTNIVMNAEGGLLDISIINGSSMINYPIVTVIVDGDTVGNINQEFYLFAHIPAQLVTHTIPTSLTSVPANFTCVVTIEDSTTGESCTLNYPCGVNGIEPMTMSVATLFPNPAIHELRIESSDVLTNVSIMDLTGRIFIEETCIAGKPLNIEALAPGIYLTKIELAGGEHTILKFTKQ
jgi:archaellum component FlaF (FlaF/FlaG flagellin family)